MGGVLSGLNQHNHCSSEGNPSPCLWLARCLGFTLFSGASFPSSGVDFGEDESDPQEGNSWDPPGYSSKSKREVNRNSTHSLPRLYSEGPREEGMFAPFSRHRMKTRPWPPSSTSSRRATWRRPRIQGEKARTGRSLWTTKGESECFGAQIFIGMQNRGDEFC